MDSCQKLTLVLGASSNPSRASYEAVMALLLKNIPVVAVGKREYSWNEMRIYKNIPDVLSEVHTVSLYLGAESQAGYYDAILSLEPKRIIFNPGTRNPELAEMAIFNGIEVVEGCMLVMLRNGEF